jgi:hypothetical protein
MRLNASASSSIRMPAKLNTTAASLFIAAAHTPPHCPYYWRGRSRCLGSTAPSLQGSELRAARGSGLTSPWDVRGS